MMAIALFSNETEKVYFYNLLAARKLKDQRKEREGYEKEIEKALNSCGKILKDYGARCNFIAEIDKIEQAMEPKGILPPSATREESNYAEQINTLTTELTDLLKKIPREVSEDLEFFSKQIIDRRRRREETSDKEEELRKFYPDADKVDFNQVFVILKEIFDNISFYSGEKIAEEPELEAKENIADVIDFTNHRQKVIGIKKAPRSLLEKAEMIDLNDYSEELAKPITKTNTGLFGIVDDVFSELNSKPITPNSIPIVEEIKQAKESSKIAVEPITENELNKPVKIETEDIEKEIQNVEPISVITEEELNEPVTEPSLEIEEDSIERNIFIEETKAEPISDITELNEPVEETVKETKEISTEETNPLIPVTELNTNIEEPNAELIEEVVEDDQNLVTFEMPDEFTLADLAQAISEDNYDWKNIYNAIYDVNKDLFTKVIAEKNEGKFEDIEYNNKIFAGLTIKIPTVINQTKEETKALGKAA